MIPDDQWDDEIGCLHQPFHTPTLNDPVTCKWCYAVGKAVITAGAWVGVEWDSRTEPATQAEGR